MRLSRGAGSIKVSAIVFFLILKLGVAPVSAIYNGVSALGSNYVVGITVGEKECNESICISSGAYACSAAPIDKYLFVTAAHCLVKKGIAVEPGSIRVYPPGADKNKVSAFAKGVYFVYPSNFYNNDISVEPNDIAFVAINRPFEINSFPKLANYEKSMEIINSNSPINVFGYGITEPGGQSSSVPNSFKAIPIAQKRYSSYVGLERKYLNFAADSRGSSCPGDSGGPSVAEHKGVSYIIAVTNGSGGPCASRSTGSMTATVAGEYPQLVSKVYDFIAAQKPNSVSDLFLSNLGEIGKLSWKSKVEDLEKIIGYSVLDEFGSEICRTSSDSNSCEVAVKPGNNLYKVISLGKYVNSEPPFTSFNVVLTSPLNPQIARRGLLGSLSWSPPAGFNKYLDYYTVRNKEGQELCKTSLNYCSVNLSIGSNDLLIFAHYQNISSEPSRLPIAINNAQPPELKGITPSRNSIEIEWGQISDFGDADATQVRFSVRDFENGEEFCNAFYPQTSCFIPLVAREYKFVLGMRTDLGSIQGESTIFYSGNNQISINESVDKQLEDSKNSLLALSKRNPGYSKEIELLLSQAPLILTSTQINQSLFEALRIFESKAKQLANKIMKQPKTITIICIKNGFSKRVIGINPKCPNGYKQK